jgi:hypothetical protein
MVGSCTRVTVGTARIVAILYHRTDPPAPDLPRDLIPKTQPPSAASSTGRTPSVPMRVFAPHAHHSAQGCSDPPRYATDPFFEAFDAAGSVPAYPHDKDMIRDIPAAAAAKRARPDHQRSAECATAPPSGCRPAGRGPLPPQHWHRAHTNNRGGGGGGGGGGG